MLPIIHYRVDVNFSLELRSLIREARYLERLGTMSVREMHWSMMSTNSNGKSLPRHPVRDLVKNQTP